MKVMHIFKAYDSRGNLALSTWANSPVTRHVEREAYQERLNRFEFMYVTVSSSDPHEPDEKLMPRKATR